MREIAGKKKKRTVIFFILVIFVAGLLLLLFFRYRRIPAETISGTDGRSLTVGVNENLPTHCVTEGGMLYGKGHRIRYYDFATDTEYVLCDEINCTHLTPRCSSRYGDQMNGLALYGDFIYFFDGVDEGEAFELIRMDTAGNRRTVLASLKAGNFEPGNRYLHGIERAYYCGDYVWAELNYGYVREDGSEERQVQCVSISLDTGEVTDVTPTEETGAIYQYEGISEKEILLHKTWGVSPDLPAGMEAYLVYHVADGNMQILEEGEQRPEYNDDGSYNGALAKYQCLGWYEDRFLCREIQWEKEKGQREIHLFLWDPETGEKRQLASLGQGAFIMFGEGSVQDIVYDGHYALFLTYLGSGRANICRADLSSGESEVLFEDADNVTFRIIGDTKDAFIGKIYNLESLSVETDVYAIKKADYYEGNFDNMTHLQTIRQSWLG